MSKFCQHFGKETDDSATFCGNCGKTLNTENSSTNISSKIYTTDILDSDESYILEKPVSNVTNKKIQTKNIILIFSISIIIFLLVIIGFLSGNLINQKSEINNEVQEINTLKEGHYYAYMCLFDDEPYSLDSIGMSSELTINPSENSFFATLTYDGVSNPLFGYYSFYSQENNLICYKLTCEDSYAGILIYDIENSEYALQVVDTDVILLYKKHDY